jgi:hypothetical protein
MFTCITLSKTPIDKAIPEGVEYINEVSIFKSMACDYAARRRAIRKVNTEHFFFLDADDIYSSMCYPTDSILIGTEYRKTEKACDLLSFSTYSKERHLQFPQIVHNAVCYNTEAVKKALSAMPLEGEYYMQQMLTYIMLETHPYAVEPALTYVWNMHAAGLHNQAKDAIKNTGVYLSNRTLDIMTI